MNDEHSPSPEVTLTFWQQHRFLALIGFALVAAITLVIISMGLYTSSGTAQLDLSRPGVKSVSGQVPTTEDNFGNFSSTGSINQSTIDTFSELFTSESGKAKTVDAFNGDPLSDINLGIDEPSDVN